MVRPLVFLRTATGRAIWARSVRGRLGLVNVDRMRELRSSRRIFPRILWLGQYLLFESRGKGARRWTANDEVRSIAEPRQT
ncbi:MAG: hypothetical protein KDK27_20765, partial [Leptospiraceae bacterium]|nr:hypothetical protein [Leptospiraceae bacterium]